MVILRIQPGALLAGLIPLIAIHVAYGLAAAAGDVPWCNPYLDSCTSISATGRHGIAYWWFKLTMIPAALVMLLFWYRVPVLLAGRADVIRWLGGVACFALMLYTLGLGESGDSFRILRQTGATLYFTLTYLAQLLVVTRLMKTSRTAPVRFMFGTCILALLTGLASLALDAFTTVQDNWEDAIEWQIALLLDSWFLGCYWHLRSSGASLTGSAGPP